MRLRGQGGGCRGIDGAGIDGDRRWCTIESVSLNSFPSSCPPWLTYTVNVVNSTTVEDIVLVGAVLVVVVVITDEAMTVDVQRSAVRRARWLAFSGSGALGTRSAARRRRLERSAAAAAREALGGWTVQVGSLRRAAILHDVVSVLVTVVVVIFGSHAGKVMVLTLVVVLVTRLGVTVTVTVFVADGYG